MKNKNTIEKQLLISLIKDDLTHLRLVYGLEKLGLEASDYFLHLSETIFKLMNIKPDDDDFYEEYHLDCQTIIDIDIAKHPELLDALAWHLYYKLKTYEP